MIIQFKTRDPHYDKEEEGDKCCTVRKIDGMLDDCRFDDLMEIIQADDYGGRKDKIKIVNPQTKESFERIITNVTYFDERFIISWKHTSQKRRKAK